MATVRLTLLQAKALGVECLGSHATVELTDALRRDLGYAIEDAYSVGYLYADKAKAALFLLDDMALDGKFTADGRLHSYADGTRA